MTDALVISNYGIGDDSFCSDVGSWNVTRAARDCAAGKHKTYNFSVAETLAHNAAIEVDAAKVAAMVADKDQLAKSPPPIFVMEDGKIWLIDGHHRLRALAQLGEPEFVAYVIEECDAKPYRMYFNGERVSPWMKKRNALSSR
ncbi:MAG TPA: ParB-like protein [Xanthobacteraceae bacterium]|jgi:hypothetical protein